MKLCSFTRALMFRAGEKGLSANFCYAKTGIEGERTS